MYEMRLWPSIHYNTLKRHIIPMSLHIQLVIHNIEDPRSLPKHPNHESKCFRGSCGCDLHLDSLLRCDPMSVSSTMTIASINSNLSDTIKTQQYRRPRGVQLRVSPRQRLGPRSVTTPGLAVRSTSVTTRPSLRPFSSSITFPPFIDSRSPIERITTPISPSAFQRKRSNPLNHHRRDRLHRPERDIRRCDWESTKPSTSTKAGATDWTDFKYTISSPAS